NCDPNPTIEIVSTVTTPGSCPQNSNVTRTWRAVDHCGNASEPCSQTIHRVDNVAPSITCPGNVTRGACNNVVNFAPLVTDNCDPAPTVVCVPASGFAFPVGTTTVTCTATDHCGNGNNCQF